MKSLNLAGMLLSLLAITACDTVETPNGVVPEEYREQVQPYLTEYTGQSEQLSGPDAMGTISFSMDEEGKVLAEYSNDSDGDLVGPRCDSSVGNLKEFSAKDKRLTEAKFELNPGYCGRIDGRTLTVEFAKDGQSLESYILEERRDHRDCRVVCRGGSGRDCYNECQTYSTYYYLEGFFKKDN